MHAPAVQQVEKASDWIISGRKTSEFASPSKKVSILFQVFLSPYVHNCHCWRLEKFIYRDSPRRRETLLSKKRHSSDDADLEDGDGEAEEDSVKLPVVFPNDYAPSLRQFIEGGGPYQVRLGFFNIHSSLAATILNGFCFCVAWLHRADCWRIH